MDPQRVARIRVRGIGHPIRPRRVVSDPLVRPTFTISLRRMDHAWLNRLRWRRRGAWLWPAFVAMIVVDAALGHLLPVAGDTESIVAGALAGLFFNLLGVLLLSRPVGALLRRARPDLPAVVARNYGGTLVVMAVSAALLAAGLVHHSTVVGNENAMRDARIRAEAWIGDRAPAEFRRNAKLSNTFAIEPGSLYRTCVPGRDGNRTYCVIVKTHLPFPRSVRFDGYEPNAVFAEGAG